MNSRDKKITIAVDGYSSCGKSTFARTIAGKLGYIYIDSGAMYRAVTLYALKKGFISKNGFNQEALIRDLPGINIAFRRNTATGENEVTLNNEAVEDQIRSFDVSDNVSQVSKIPEVRNSMVKIQRKLGDEKGIVMDGRDIGTVVFPDAELKIFMTATPEVRARRRYDELKQKGQKVDFNKVLENINTRDNIDENRETSPLRKADDAIILDNSNMTPAEQWAWLEDLLKEKYDLAAFEA